MGKLSDRNEQELGLPCPDVLCLAPTQTSLPKHRTRGAGGSPGDGIHVAKWPDPHTEEGDGGGLREEGGEVSPPPLLLSLCLKKKGS